MVKKKTAALLSVAALVAVAVPISVSASPEVALPAARGLEEITTIGVGNVIAAYSVGTTVQSADVYGQFDSDTVAAMFDNDISTSVTIYRNDPQPWLGGFVLDAGEGNTFADVVEIDLSCVGGNGDDIYIFGSNSNIHEAVLKNMETNPVTNSNDYSDFNETTFGISIDKLINGETAFYHFATDYEVTGLQDSYWGTYPLENSNYRYLYIGTPRWKQSWRIDEIKFMKKSDNKCQLTTSITGSGTVTFTDTDGNVITEAEYGSDVTVTATAADGYELGKIDINGRTVAPSPNNSTSYTISDISADTAVSACFDSSTGKITLDYLSGTAVNQELSDGILVGTDGYSQGGDYGAKDSSTVFDAGDGKAYSLTNAVVYGRGPNSGGTTYTKRASLLVQGSNDNETWNTIGRLGTDSWSNTGGDTFNTRYENTLDPTEYRYVRFTADKGYVSIAELKLYGSVVKNTHNSGYFAFEATETEMNAFNKIAIKLNDGIIKVDAFNPTTIFGGSGDVKYAIRITELPKEKEVEAIKLYTIE